MKKSIDQYVSGIVCHEDDVLSIKVDKAKAGGLLTADIVELIDTLIANDTEAADVHEKKYNEIDNQKEDTQKPSQPSTNKTTKSVKTGDNTVMSSYAIMMLLAAGAYTAIKKTAE